VYFTIGHKFNNYNDRSQNSRGAEPAKAGLFEKRLPDCPAAGIFITKQGYDAKSKA
jgi:hypothetical protein